MRAKYRGVVLLVVLLLLVAMSLTGIALLRSGETHGLIAANHAFQQGALLSAESCIETARTWLVSNSTSKLLFSDSAPDGYFATAGSGVSFINNPQFAWATLASKPLTNAAGYQAHYVIHRLCNVAGDPASGIDCVRGPITASSSKAAPSSNNLPMNAPGAVVYRITIQITGPRNTVSYVQAYIT